MIDDLLYCIQTENIFEYFLFFAIMCVFDT